MLCQYVFRCTLTAIFKDVSGLHACIQQPLCANMAWEFYGSGVAAVQRSMTFTSREQVLAVFAVPIADICSGQCDPCTVAAVAPEGRSAH